MRFGLAARRAFFAGAFAISALHGPGLSAQPTFATATPAAENLGETFATVFFSPSSIEIEPAGRELLDLIATILNGDLADKPIHIVGHAAKGGDPADPEEISAERARQVAGYLVTKRIDAERITLEWRGSGEPLLAGEFALNRRVAIYVR